MLKDVGDQLFVVDIAANTTEQRCSQPWRRKPQIFGHVLSTETTSIDHQTKYGRPSVQCNEAPHCLIAIDFELLMDF